MLQHVSSHGLSERSLPAIGLRAAFEDALPGPKWAAHASTRVLVALIEPKDWQPWLVAARDLLDASERDRVDRRRLAAHREQLTLCYALHRLLLGKVLGCDPCDVPIRRDARGCPRLFDVPLFTSLSHADDCIALAVTATGAVGVDVESVARAPVMPEIAQRVCHPVDAAELAGLIGPAWCAGLLSLWVRKEALLKAAGVGLAREMNTFSLPAGGVLPLSPPAGELIQLQMVDAGAQWTAAVAAPPDVAIECARLRPDGSARLH